QRLAVELAALALGQLFAQKNLFGRFEGGKHAPAVMQDVIGADTRARSQDDVAHHLLAVDAVRHTNSCDFRHFGALHQQAVDLERRDVDAAADDKFLLPSSQVEKAVGVEKAEVSGLHPCAAVDLDGSVLGQVAVAVVVEAADLDRSRFSRVQRCSLAAHDAKLEIWHRLADRTQASVFARIARDPADLAAAVALADANAEALLEALPFLQQEGRRAGRGE